MSCIKSQYDAVLGDLPSAPPGNQDCHKQFLNAGNVQADRLAAGKHMVHGILALQTTSGNIGYGPGRVAHWSCCCREQRRAIVAGCAEASDSGPI